jgi:antitoxin PrlF
MAVATLTSKGQITMPLSVRNALGLRPGAKVDFVS